MVRFLIVLSAAQITLMMADFSNKKFFISYATWVRSVGPASLLAMMWTALSWQREGGIFALSSGGRSPWMVTLMLAGMTLPFVAATYWPETPREPSLHFDARQITVSGQHPTHFTWSSEGVERIYQGQKSTTKGIRPPPPPGARNELVPAAVFAFKMLAAFGVVIWLSQGWATKTTSAILGTTSLIALCELLRRIVALA